MLIEIIRTHMNQARLGADSVRKSLLVTLYAEALRVGKDKRNGITSDEEVIQVVRKFLNNVEETRQLLQSRSQPTPVQDQEIELLNVYLPAQMDQSQLTQVVSQIVQELGLTSIKSLGAVMAELKKRHAGAYDGKLAQQVVKQILSA